MNENGITVILTGYRRPDNLREQLAAIHHQTVQPEEIFFFQDAATPSVNFDLSLLEGINHVKASKNIGVWGRFAVGFWAKTKYVCIFDDDTIPGARWLENCMNTIQIHRGLLGTIGIIFNPHDDYIHYISRVGWDNPNDTTIEVDIVGHSWFFERDWLTVFWKDSDNYAQFSKVGEDIHFSFMLQKYLGLKTYVPPHPADDISLFGSLPNRAFKLGVNEEAISFSPDNQKFMNTYLQVCIKNGFKLLANDFHYEKNEQGLTRLEKTQQDKRIDSLIKQSGINTIKISFRNGFKKLRRSLGKFYRTFITHRKSNLYV